MPSARQAALWVAVGGLAAISASLAAEEKAPLPKTTLIVQGKLFSGDPPKPCEGAEVTAHNIEDDNPTLEAGEKGVVTNPRAKVDATGHFSLKIPRDFLKALEFTLTYANCGTRQWMMLPVRTPDKKLVKYQVPAAGIHLDVGQLSVK